MDDKTKITFKKELNELFEDFYKRVEGKSREDHLKSIFSEKVEIKFE